MGKKYFKAGEFYHVFNKSIASFRIFNTRKNCERFINTLSYYNDTSINLSFSKFILKNSDYDAGLLDLKENSILKFIANCIMPDHYHLVVKCLFNDSISRYISNVENSYTKFLNIKINRKGPLWQSRFKSVRITTNEQLLHVTRYVHLNPTTNNLVLKPEDWLYSSYRNYIFEEKILKEVLTEISINNPKSYRKFTENRINYQRKLKLIKKLILE